MYEKLLGAKYLFIILIIYSKKIKDTHDHVVSNHCNQNRVIVQRFVIDQVLIKTSKMFHRMLQNVLYPGVIQVRIEH